MLVALRDPAARAAPSCLCVFVVNRRTVPSSPAYGLLRYARNDTVRVGRNFAMSMSREFATFVANLKFEDLPPAVGDRPKGRTLQALISALLPRNMAPSRDALGLR